MSQEMNNNGLTAINHVVVLMLENRSFDHMLGFLYADRGNVSPAGQPFDGLTGKESNQDGSGKAVPVFEIDSAHSNPYFMPGANPGEGYNATNSQLFGTTKAPSPPLASNDGFVTDFAYTLGWEAKEGWSILAGTVARDIMGMFTPTMLPVLSGLARGFAVCDQWFSSAPTETLPNRAFVCAATSQGHMEFKDFQAAAAAGKLPPFTFLEPSWGSDGNSQHPNYDVALGEQLIHDVYYALCNGPGWNQTLLIITYDEHGGCYDHVAPPANAVPPDNSAGEYGFDFKRFGLRVPTVLVSPLIAPGTVFRAPAGSTPLDHTSILKTVEQRWGLPALTARDAAASGIGAVLTLATPRTDDPLQGVTVPQARPGNPPDPRPSHLELMHAEQVSQLPVPDAAGGMHHAPPVLRTSSDYRNYIKERIAAWKAARAHR